MRLSSLSTLLLGSGVVVAVTGAIAIGLGVRVDLPPAAQTLIFFKLLFIGAAGLIGAGAIIGRLARRRADGRPRSASTPRELGAPAPPIPPRAEPEAHDRVRDAAS